MSAREQLHLGLIGQGLADRPELEQKLWQYLQMLSKWNKVYNLTAIRDLEQMISHHLLDSLAVLPCLDGVGRLVDIGSGGGLPGIPLALARPDWQIFSVETVNKKSTFQQQAKIELNLSHFHPICSRVELWQPEVLMDGCISRAFAELSDFVRLADPLVRPGGRFFAMKGVYPQEEIERLPAQFTVVDVQVLKVALLGAERHLVIVERK
jgi:16S rRNA (guanine527-N7)-methyltransferase